MKGYIFVNAKFVMATVALAIFAFAFVDPPEPAANEDFFESVFDGTWAGFLVTKGLDLPLYPALININAQGAGGRGFALALEDETDSIERFAPQELMDIKVSGNSINFNFQVTTGNSPATQGTVSFKLSYKSASSSLNGKFSSSANVLGNGKVTFYKLDSSNPIAGLFTGDNPKGKPTMLSVQSDSSLSGLGLVGDSTGKLSDSQMTGKKFEGTVAIKKDPHTFSLKFSSKKLTLKGKVKESSGASFPVKLTAVGATGKKPSLGSVTPGTIVIDISEAPQTAVTAQVAVNGNNFSPGAVLHLSNAAFSVSQLSVTRSKITFTMGIPDNVTDGTFVSVMVVNPDDQRIEKSNAIKIEVNDDNDGGGGGGGGGGGATVSFINDIQPIFNGSCNGCHVGGSQGGFSMSSTNAWADIVNVGSSNGFLYIEPNNPDDSYIIMKLRGDSRINGSQMPRGRAPLSEETINRIVTWINEGALNN